MRKGLIAGFISWLAMNSSLLSQMWVEMLRSWVQGLPNSARGQWCRRSIVLMLVSCSVEAALAQQPFGTIVGTITDPDAATLPAATVIVTNTDTQISRTVITNDTGEYSVPYLANGRYTIKVEHAGFQTSTMSDVVLRAAEILRTDIRMKLGEVREFANVSATTIALQTDSPVVGTTIASKSINELPLNGRTFAQLANVEDLGANVENGACIVTACTSCGHMFKAEYPRLLKDDPQLAPLANAISEHTYDFAEFLLEFAGRPELHPVKLRLAYHAPCHLKGQGIGRPWATNSACDPRNRD